MSDNDVPRLHWDRCWHRPWSLAACRATAGPGREGYCIVSETKCDRSAK